MPSQRYIELHGLEFDLKYSACGHCEYGQSGNCQHYYGYGCVNGDKNESDC